MVVFRNGERREEWIGRLDDCPPQVENENAIKGRRLKQDMILYT